MRIPRQGLESILRAGDNRDMPNRSRRPKRRLDLAELAKRIVDEATGQISRTPPPDEGKDPIAVELGRRGGLKGGKARAARMTKKQRSESAKKAAKARWKEKERPPIEAST